MQGDYYMQINQNVREKGGVQVEQRIHEFVPGSSALHMAVEDVSGKGDSSFI